MTLNKLLVLVLVFSICSCSARRARTWEALADEAADEFKPDEALSYLENAIEITPHNSRLHYKKSTLLQETNKFEQALESINTAIKYTNSINLEYLMKAEILYDLGMIDSSLFYHNLSILNAENAEIAFEGRAKTYLQINEIDLAMADFDKAIFINPEYLRTYFSRGEFLYNAREDYNGAIRDFSVIIDNSSKLVNRELFLSSIYAFRGLCYYEIGNVESACKDWHLASNLGFEDVNNLIDKNCK
ncbi:tetratricopeptide repeat protein [Roseivirga ehrenbergii]|uniref:Uncharacterized protein n=1 Tax=Roseivirga ehrenbergii (strain DSM 102268 / JCM 13514 / KCTC 12282 / NCIMB 14502 / KMM 6017) TaxID=279360 RepID=A0A150XQX4_ROSEK|nr:tetratricopeptide repeat protein [Roseivirga ehrenbergii]KYG81101.1 hypothetical protein MB14_15115 [Roseivirga ehrenbergii]TCL00977.1 tetratricopeptide repeat protein [Roseivirga ehrenbergii]